MMTDCGSYVRLTLFVLILMTIVDGQFTVDLRLGEQPFYERGTKYSVCGNTYVNITCFTTESLHFTNISINRGQRQLLNSTERAYLSVRDRLPNTAKKEDYTCDLWFSSINDEKFTLTLKLTAVLPLDYLEEKQAECSNDRDRKTTDGEKSENPTDSMQNSTSPEGEDNSQPAQSTTCSQHELCVVNLVLSQRFSYGLKRLNFVCISNPAAPMYWMIIGEKGNILDQRNVNKSLKVDTNITIHQSLGNTTIEVVEGPNGSNGIHTVICATYGSYLGVATAHLDMSEARMSSTSLSSSKKSSVTSDFPLGTVLTSTNATPEVYKQRAATNTQPTSSSMTMPMVMILIGLVITIVIIVLGVIVAFLHQRKEKPPKNTQNDVIYDVVYPETVFTRNPAYQSYDDDDLGPPPCLPPVTSKATPYKDTGKDVYSYIDDSEKPNQDENCDCELTKQSTPIT